MPIDLRIYANDRGREPFTEWLENLDRQLRARIEKRLDRIREGNLGDFKALGDGVLEIRFHFGSGYRIYFGQEGSELVLLLCGGDKSSQEEDIKTAKDYWRNRESS